MHRPSYRPTRAHPAWLGLYVLVGIACHPPPPPPAEDPPAWAYPLPVAVDAVPSPVDGAPRHVPESALSLTVAETNDPFSAPDWHPTDHPPMPAVVAHGREPDVWACGYCHRADGAGGPENSSLAGLPAEYIAQQIADFASGRRKTAVPARMPTTWMAELAKALTPREIAESASYFAGLSPRATQRVVEAPLVPQTYVAEWVLADDKTGHTEPIGARIIEVPDDLERFEDRDSRARFTAYVPPGSVARGRALATTGEGRTAPCTTCHGLDLRGVGTIPRLAGRSPSYLARQLFEFKRGTRAGIGAQSMAPVVRNLGAEERIALAAYLASLPP